MPVDEKRKWLADKSDRKGFREYDRYANELGVSLAGDVVELGAGDCWLSAWLSAKPAISHVTAVELSAERVQSFADVSNELFGGDPGKITYAAGDMHRIERDDNSVDLVTCDATLHHADNLIAVMRECRRILKPGGQFIAFREPSIAATRLRMPVFDENTPEQGSAYYYTRGGWRSAWVNGRFTDIRLTRFYENLTVKGRQIDRNLQRRFRPGMMPLWMTIGYPKLVMAARKP